MLRKIAATDYTCDPDGHSARWHYERADRPYRTAVLWKSFERWSIEDRWAERRERYWEGVEQRVRDHMQDDYVRQRLVYIDFITTTLNELTVFLKPLVDKNGKAKIDENGLPVYPLKVPSMDKFARMWLELHERLILQHGEATSRPDRPSEEGDDAPLNEHLRHRPIPPKISRADARAMARILLARAQQPIRVEAIDAPVEAENNEPDRGNEHPQVRTGAAEPGPAGADE